MTSAPSGRRRAATGSTAGRCLRYAYAGVWSCATYQSRHDGMMRHRLEQHRRDVDREELDLLVHVLDVVISCMRLKYGQRVVEEREPDLAALAGAGRAHRRRPRLARLGQHRLEALPVGQRAQRRVVGHEVVQVRRARARAGRRSRSGARSRRRGSRGARARAPRPGGGSSVTRRSCACALIRPKADSPASVSRARERRRRGARGTSRRRSRRGRSRRAPARAARRARTTGRRPSARPPSSSRRCAAGRPGRRGRRCGPAAGRSLTARSVAARFARRPAHPTTRSGGCSPPN